MKSLNIVSLAMMAFSILFSPLAWSGDRSPSSPEKLEHALANGDHVRAEDQFETQEHFICVCLTVKQMTNSWKPGEDAELGVKTIHWYMGQYGSRQKAKPYCETYGEDFVISLDSTKRRPQARRPGPVLYLDDPVYLRETPIFSCRVMPLFDEH